MWAMLQFRARTGVTAVPARTRDSASRNAKAERVAREAALPEAPAERAACSAGRRGRMGAASRPEARAAAAAPRRATGRSAVTAWTDFRRGTVPRESASVTSLRSAISLHRADTL